VAFSLFSCFMLSLPHFRIIILVLLMQIAALGWTQ
jgi:hypothetical protein